MLSWWIHVARQADYCGSGTDPLDHEIGHAGNRPSAVLPREGLGLLPGTVHQGGIRQSRKGKVRLQGRLYLGWHSAPRLTTHS
jgi:hypothetical protein